MTKSKERFSFKQLGNHEYIKKTQKKKRFYIHYIQIFHDLTSILDTYLKETLRKKCSHSELF